MIDPATLSPHLPAIAAHCAGCYPDEACGILLAGPRGARFIPIPNIAGTSASAGTSNRTGRDGYVMEPQRLMVELEAGEPRGESLAVIIHSHPDVGAYFSREDREMALGGADEPLWPGVDYLVISCRGGRCDQARLYGWNRAAADFDELVVPMP